MCVCGWIENFLIWNNVVLKYKREKVESGHKRTTERSPDLYRPNIYNTNSLQGYYHTIVPLESGSVENITFQTHGLSLESFVSNTASYSYQQSDFNSFIVYIETEQIRDENRRIFVWAKLNLFQKTINLPDQPLRNNFTSFLEIAANYYHEDCHKQ